MKELVIELINDTNVSINDDYFFLDDILNKLNNNDDFIQIRNNIFAKNEIRKISVRDIPTTKEEE